MGLEFANEVLTAEGEAVEAAAPGVARGGKGTSVQAATTGTDEAIEATGVKTFRSTATKGLDLHFERCKSAAQRDKFPLIGILATMTIRNSLHQVRERQVLIDGEFPT